MKRVILDLTGDAGQGARVVKYSSAYPDEPTSKVVTNPQPGGKII